MNTRMKMMGLAALPLAGLLATGGVAMAQGAGAPAGTQVVQQAAIHKAGDPCPQHVVKTAPSRQASTSRRGTVTARTAATTRARPCRRPPA